MRKARRIFIALAAIVVLLGCQTDDFELKEKEFIVGPEGGVIKGEDISSDLRGVSVEIPPNAVQELVTVQISKLAMAPAFPNGIFSANGAIKITTIPYTVFTLPVIVTLPYHIPSDITPDYLDAFTFNEDTQKWEPVTIVGIDESIKNVTLAVIHFSLLDVIFYSGPIPNEANSGFNFEVDGFSISNNVDFPNNPKGACWGMSCYSQWYFLVKKGSSDGLFLKYRNPKIAIRVADDAQTQLSSSILDNIYSGLIFFDADPLHSFWVVSRIMHRLVNTNEPQLLLMRNVEDFTGHAVLVYAYEIDEANNKIYLYVYNPNYCSDSIIRYSSDRTKITYNYLQLKFEEYDGYELFTDAVCHLIFPLGYAGFESIFNNMEGLTLCGDECRIGPQHCYRGIESGQYCYFGDEAAYCSEENALILCGYEDEDNCKDWKTRPCHNGLCDVQGCHCIPCADRDEDGFLNDDCGGTDCNDNNRFIYPGAAEICNNLDDDCNNETDERLTQRCSTICGAGTEYCSAGRWVGCNAPQPNICTNYNTCGSFERCEVCPAAPSEICDGMDNDCNGHVDHGIICRCTNGQTRTADCGSNIGECEYGSQAQLCVDGRWVNQGSCVGAVDPIEEICNGLDDDCDNAFDEIEGCCQSGDTQSCGTNNIGECRLGTKTCQNGVWGNCVGAIEPVPEICNDNLDNDCNGVPDDPEVCAPAAGCQLGQKVELVAGAQFATQLDAVWTGEDFAVCWKNNDNEPWFIEFAHFAPDGQRRTNIKRLSLGGEHPDYCQVAKGAGGVGVVWGDGRHEVGGEVSFPDYFAELNSNADYLISPIEVVPSVYGGAAYYVGLTFSGGKYGLVWENDRQTGELLFGTIDSANRQIANIRSITTAGVFPFITPSSNGYFVIWLVMPQNGINFAQLSTNGTILSQRQIFSSTECNSGNNAMVSDGVGFAVACYHSDPRFSLFSQFRPDGTRRIQPVRFAENVGGPYHKLAWNGQQYGLARPNVFQRVDQNGTFIDDPLQMRDGPIALYKLLWTGDKWTAVWTEGSSEPGGSVKIYTQDIVCQ